MEIRFVVYPMVEVIGDVRPPRAWNLKLTFQSNINMAETTIQKVIPNEYSVDIRRRIIHDMFRELKDRVFEQEKAFDDFLAEMKKA